MNKIRRLLVWLSRIHRCRGFGIQSPTDYAFVRYVVNEHWPYYAYEHLDRLTTDGERRKLGRLYFRLANWRQPATMPTDEWRPYWQAGCHKTRFQTDVERVELARVSVEDVERWEALVGRCDERSVMVVEGIYRDWSRWRAITADSRATVTFDLYYCGIVFFNPKRYKHHYCINF